MHGGIGFAPYMHSAVALSVAAAKVWYLQGMWFQKTERTVNCLPSFLSH